MDNTQINNIVNSFKDNDIKIDLNEFIIAFTDGSASKNGNRNAVGGYASLFPNYLEYNIKQVVTENVTNNRCEYQAAIDTILQFNKINEVENINKKLIIHSDSLLLVKTITEWMKNWKKKGWMRSGNKPVENLDLVKILYNLYDEKKITFKWVRAHSKNKDYYSTMNNIVDEMSRCYL